MNECDELDGVLEAVVAALRVQEKAEREQELQAAQDEV